MIIATYSRYSSDNQRETSIEDQVRAQDERCRREGWGPSPALRFADRAISGARLDRPAYTAMMAAAARREFQVLLVWDLARLGRDQVESLRAMKLLRFHQVRVIGVSDGFDGDRRSAKLEGGMRALMNESYLDDLAENVHRGLTGLAMKGLSAGGLAYGYRSVEVLGGHGRQVLEDEASWVRWIFQHAALGWNPARIARELNAQGARGPRGRPWTYSAIYADSRRGAGILANRAYLGELTWNRSKWVKDPLSGRRKRLGRPESEWIRTQQESLRIVTDELWEAAHVAMGAQGETPKGRPGRYLLSGILVCGICQSHYVMAGRYTYVCNGYRRDLCANGRSVSKRMAEERLLGAVKDALLDEGAWIVFERETRRLLAEAAGDVDQRRQDLARATRERDNLLDALREGIRTPGTLQALETAEHQVETAAMAIRAADSAAPAQILPRARGMCRELVQQLENIEDVDAARLALRELFGEIRLIPEDEGLVAELTPSLPGLTGQIKLVAGARFESYLLEAVRIPLTGKGF